MMMMDDCEKITVRSENGRHKFSRISCLARNTRWTPSCPVVCRVGPDAYSEAECNPVNSFRSRVHDVTSTHKYLYTYFYTLLASNISNINVPYIYIDIFYN